MTGPDLKRLRESFGLTQTQASKQAEVSLRTWQRWEARRRVPEGAVKLFKLLNNVKA